MEEIHSEGSGEKEALYDDMCEVLEQQINQLDPIPREVLMLHYFSEMSTAEIAKAMGVSQAAILKRLQRAREALGVKLIHELKVIPPAELDTKQQRRTIMSSIAASGLIWKLGSMGIASATVGVLTSGKAMVAGLLVIGIAGTSAIMATQDQPAENNKLVIPLDTDKGIDESHMADTSKSPLKAKNTSEEVVPKLILA